MHVDHLYIIEVIYNLKKHFFIYVDRKSIDTQEVNFNLVLFE